MTFKGADRFIHNYQAPGNDGYNTFVGVNSGNFAMSGSDLASSNTGVGYSLLSSITTGTLNSAFGSIRFLGNTTGDYNAAFGGNSLVIILKDTTILLLGTVLFFTILQGDPIPLVVLEH